MCLEYVRFDATPPLVAHNIDIRDAALVDPTRHDPLDGYVDQLQASCQQLRMLQHMHRTRLHIPSDPCANAQHLDAVCQVMEAAHWSSTLAGQLERHCLALFCNSVMQADMYVASRFP